MLKYLKLIERENGAGYADADLMGDVMFGVLIFTPIIMVCIVNFVANPPLWIKCGVACAMACVSVG